MSDTDPTAPLSTTYWVLPGQFLAGDHPGDPNSEFARKRLITLLDGGIRTFLDLTEEDEINEDAKLVPGYWAQLRGLIEERRTDVTYMRIPVTDRGVPSVWMMRRILDVIEKSIADENPVFLHCWAGRGRTGTAVGCFLKRRSLASDNDVIQKIAHLRRLVPTGRETSPHTAEQVRMVKNWKQGA